jgi:glutaminyl-tRNA synthetase
MEAVNNPEDPQSGTREVPFSRVLYIEQDDFREDAPRKFFRLKPGGEVRLRYAYIIKCEEVVKDELTGEIVELRCTCDWETLGKQPEDRKVKGVIHWVSAAHAAEVEVRLYDRLFTKEDPDDLAEGEDYKTYLNPDSLQVLAGCKTEPSLAAAQPGQRFQFERLGYFCVDARRFPAWRPRLQPHRLPAGHLGEDRESREVSRSGANNSEATAARTLRETPRT